MMKDKTLLIAMLLLGSLSVAPIQALAREEFECRVEKVINGIWEEGLGEYGDPDADDDSEVVRFPSVVQKEPFSLKVGHMSYDGRTVQITREITPTAQILNVFDVDGTRIQLRFYFKSQRGVVLYADPRAKLTPLASFDCSKVEQVMNASIGQSQVRRLTTAQYQKLEAKVRERLEKVDFAYEMGDGYYDLKELRFYEVRKDDSKEVAGYMAWAKLYYTEDQEYRTALVRFDRNGLRLSPEIETLGSCEGALE